MLFFIKIKLSSRLCLTHKRVTQKYRNSTLIKKKKPALGSDRNRRYSEFSGSDRIGSEKMVSLHPYFRHFQNCCNRDGNTTFKYMNYVPIVVATRFGIAFLCSREGGVPILLSI